MSSILKKIMAFAALLIAVGHIKAQVPGNAPVKKFNPAITRPAELHSFSWYKADMLKRYPQLSAQATKHAPLSGMRTMQSLPTYAQMRQNLFQQYPQLQQRAMIAAQSRTLSTGNTRQPAQRSFDFYRAQVQKQIEKARMQAEQIRQQNLHRQEPMQQSPVQELPVQNQLPASQTQTVQPPIQQRPFQNTPVENQLQQPRKQTPRPAPRTTKATTMPAAANQ